MSKQVDDRTLLLFWEFTMEKMSEINLVSNQHLAIEMFLIRMIYLKKKSINNLEKIESSNNDVSIHNIPKDENLSNELDNIKKNNKTINQIKFSSQKKEKHLIDMIILDNHSIIELKMPF